MYKKCAVPLKSAERAFLTRIERAVSANPFGHEREALDRELVPDATAPRSEIVDRVLETLAGELRRIGGGRPVVVRRYSAPDRELVERAVLFEVFHRYAEDFDALIERETRAKERPPEVPFAKAALGDLASHGFSEEDAVRYFAIFWQMRRAFHLIETTLTGESPCMVSLRESLWNNVFTHDLALYVRLLSQRMDDFSTFIVGETGTGKGAAASAIGRSGFIPFDAKRRRFAASFVDAFVATNVSEFSATLIESELFGHEKGAFTGAIAQHRGVLARCSRYGAIFLDEIGELGAPIQIKLLNVLQDRSFRPVGSHQSQRFEGRVIAATNRDVTALRQSGSFRDDLYYRLCSDVIELPTLRRRLDEDPRELERLIGAVLGSMVGSAEPELTGRVGEAVLADVGASYLWPGNVRELEQCVRRVLIARHYRPEAPPRRGEDDALMAATDGGSWSAEELLNRYCAALHRRAGTYDGVATKVGLDRRTVKRHVLAGR